MAEAAVADHPVGQRLERVPLRQATLVFLLLATLDAAVPGRPAGRSGE